MPVDRNDPNRELYSIAVVTVDESSFPEMRRALAISMGSCSIWTASVKAQGTGSMW